MKISRKSIFVFTSVILSVPLGQLYIDIYVPAFPSLQENFHTSVSSIQLSLTIYLVMMGIGQIIYGIASDIIGRKKPLILALILGIIGTSIILTSQTITMFLVGRVIQGLGMAGVAGIGGAILVDYFTNKDDLARKNNYLSMIYNLTPVIAPYIGGTILHLFNWKGIFVFLLAYNGLILIWICLFLQETNLLIEPAKSRRIITKLVSLKNVVNNFNFWLLSILLGIFWGMTMVFLTLSPFILKNQYSISGFEFGIISLCMGGFAFIGGLSNRVLLRWVKGPGLLYFFISSNVLISFILVLFNMCFTLNLLTLLVFFALIFYTYGAIYPNAYTQFMLLFRNCAGTAISLSCSVTILTCMTMTLIAVIIPATLSSLVVFELILSFVGFCCFLIYKAL